MRRYRMNLFVVHSRAGVLVLGIIVAEGPAFGKLERALLTSVFSIFFHTPGEETLKFLGSVQCLSSKALHELCYRL